MKIMLSAVSALLFTLAFAQGAEAKRKVLATETRCNTEKHQPLLDQKATGGIVPSTGLTAKTAEPGQAYPPALWIHF
ncbi:hypothetical protein RFN28_33455 [Mesorhizobium sp. VK24D]|uniref:DUF680 domain-containing protein n=1 Tax=Mesorhizobium album TaxID=3072314 RepID=A0ABU4Y8R4_9HYPH|nr:hypothetical protein [Mesorhizobium sp. VK24D]MDX8483319.1 hypothetical protein [Mesorhizobium sp. VK24D]